MSGQKEQHFVALQNKLHDAGQDHLLNFYHQLSSDDKQAFLRDIEQLDLGQLVSIYQDAVRKLRDASSTEYTYVPPPVALRWDSPTRCILNRSYVDGDTMSAPSFVTRLSNTPKDVVDCWRRRGFEMIALGQVGSVILAGGQGTRLGWNHPKGTYPIGPVSGKSLFQLLCEKHSAIQRLARDDQKKCDRSIEKQLFRNTPLYLMTSEDTHSDTVAFFERHNYFGLGLDRKDVQFFQQENMPAFSLDGKLFLQNKGQILRAPNGNGGLFLSLLRSGILDDMKKRNLEGFHVFSVDNGLLKVLDPVLIGYSDLLGADIGNKCAEKIDPDEKVGVMSLRYSKGGPKPVYEACVIEYTEIPDQFRTKRSADTTKNAASALSSPLMFSSGNICSHFFKLDFIERFVRVHNWLQQLPPHASPKKIPHLDAETGHYVVPSQNNGIKIEYFIFDCFPYANRVVGLEVDRAYEFAPLKDRTGVNSPEACQESLSNAYKAWMRNGGVLLAEGGHLEISPIISYEGEHLEAFRTAPIVLPKYIASLPSNSATSIAHNTTNVTQLNSGA